MRRLDAHMSKNALHTDSAFGYKTHHSTEGMMLGLTNDILTGFDNNQCTVMPFLDLSAAFDTIDIEKMVNIMETEIGVTDIALSWIRSFSQVENKKSKLITVILASLMFCSVHHKDQCWVQSSLIYMFGLSQECSITVDS